MRLVIAAAAVRMAGGGAGVCASGGGWRGWLGWLGGLGAAGLASDLGVTRPASQASLLSDLRSASALCEAPEAAPGTLDLSVIKSSRTNGPLPSQEVDASARTAFSGKLVSRLALTT